MEVTRVLRFLEAYPGFAYFECMAPILGLGSYSHLLPMRVLISKTKRTSSSSSSTPYYLSYQGGGDIGGIYDIGLKRGFYGI
jgi:hypothetical protein